MTQLTILLLGSPTLSVDGAPVRVDTRKAIALIAYLALHPGAQTRETLAALLWPDLNQARARAALRRTLSVLNRSDMAPWLTIERSSVELCVNSSMSIDVLAFDRLVAECREHGHGPDVACPRCVEPLTTAAGLYRDDFLAGFTLRDSVNFDDWQFFMAEELRSNYVHALDRLVEALTAEGQYGRAIEPARRRLHADPLHEAAHRQLMKLFVWSDQRNAALRQYRECVRILDEELGVPPLDETTELYESIYGNLPLPQPRSMIGEPAPVASSAPVSGRSPSPLPTALVGRSRAWSTLTEALGCAEDGHLVVIAGEAGIGKTTLLGRFMAAAAAEGHPTLSTQCFYGESELAYAPIRALLSEALSLPDAAERLAQMPAQWLAEASRLAPALAGESTAPAEQPQPEDGAAKGRFFEAVNQVLGALASDLKPVCIAVDNVHWADNATLELLSYLARRLAGRPLCLILTWRSEEFAGENLRRRTGFDMIREATRTEILLERLTLDDIEQLLGESNLVAADKQTGVAERLLEVSAGIPLFVVEYMALLNQSPALVNEPRWSLPDGIRSLLESRIAPIGDAGRQLLTAAAVIGRSFDYDTLRTVSGRSDEECVAALEELLAHRLVRELENAGYDFHHDQLRGLVYGETSRARRRLLHRRVADALLAAVRRDNSATQPLSAVLAHHYAEGDLTDEAIAAYVDAADQATSVFANREAIRYLESALALGSQEIASIHERLGDLHMVLGEYPQARSGYEAAAARAAGSQSARLEGKLGDLHHRLGNVPLARRHFEAAVDDERLEQVWRSRFLAQWSLAAQQDGDHDRALALAQTSLAESIQSDDAAALAESHNILSILARHAGDPAEAIEQAQRSLHYADQQPVRPETRAAALNSLALAHASAGDQERAVKLTREALELALALGDRHRAAALHNHLADYHHAMGNQAAANEQIRAAVQLFAEIGADGLDLNPGIWKLEEW